MKPVLLLVLLIVGSTCVSADERAVSDSEQLNDGLIAYTRLEHTLAADLLTPVAERGNPVAQLLLGKTLLSKEYDGRDCRAGLNWLRKSAQNGNAEAAFELGESFRTGVCVPMDLLIALRWYLEAYDRGYGDASNSIGEMYMLRPRDQESVHEAIEWFVKGVVKYNWRAARHLGEIYKAGLGVRRDPKEAFRWFQITYLQMPYYSDDEREEVLRLRDQARDCLTPAQVQKEMDEAEKMLVAIVENRDGIGGQMLSSLPDDTPASTTFAN